MPDTWYDIEKAYFLDATTGAVVKRFVVFRCGVSFERQFETYEEAEAYIADRLMAIR